MTLDKNFPKSPYEILVPDVRWFPSTDASNKILREKLLPPLVTKIRQEIYEWRRQDYPKVSHTSWALLHWWFQETHFKKEGGAVEFRYYFAQREAIETIIYLYEVAKIKSKYDLLRYDSSGILSASMFEEDWVRFVVKMATGTGKTKVISLMITWSYFHKLYEPESRLATNFLIITPNIIVLDRLRKDFEELEIFQDDPLIPINGFEGSNWLDDWRQIKVHVQDQVSMASPTRNIFLTNIHRVYPIKAETPNIDDENSENYFLGKAPVTKTNDSIVDLNMIVRGLDELVIINDEAHHVHDSRLMWFSSIDGIHRCLQQKGSFLSLQLDVTATPKRSNGTIFVQTVSDYPLVEAIQQNVVKHLVIPNQESRGKLIEYPSSDYCEKYKDFIELGVIEWRKAHLEHKIAGKKAILFIMTDDTHHCDDIAEYLEKQYPEFKDKILVIHTNKNGEFESSTSQKNKEELDELRKKARKIDSNHSQYDVIISVLMLKEGWDVKNVTTIIGLRSYQAESNILAEQTLGRGLRRMYPGEDRIEDLSVVGTNAFMEFVSNIQKEEGVELEKRPMGKSAPDFFILIQVDQENKSKDIAKLDIKIPILSSRVSREYERLNSLDTSNFGNKKIPYQITVKQEKREIIFEDIATYEVDHITELDSIHVADSRNIIGYFTDKIIKRLRLVYCYDMIYSKVKDFIVSHLFDCTVSLDDPNLLRNLEDIGVQKTIIETFVQKINDLTLCCRQDKTQIHIRDYIQLSHTPHFIVSQQEYYTPQKSVFNKIIGDSHLELEFSAFLDRCPDIISYAKNYLAIHFSIDYVKADNQFSMYYPDFIVKSDPKHIYIVETKGLSDLDVPLQIARLSQWCQDANRVQQDVVFDYVFVEQEDFQRYTPNSFAGLVRNFVKYK